MPPDEVYEVALAGNATMVHLVLGIDPEPLGVAPFIMSARLLPEVRARDLGVPAHPQARAVVFPAFGAYVGGDITAGLLASGMDRDPRIRLFIDIGTNCEIVLGGRDWLLATAAPAGPAFEGASIRCGMRAADGAIEAVEITGDGDLKLTVIGDTDPAGLCGSGLVDAVAALTEAGLIDASGRFAQDSPMERFPDAEEARWPGAAPGGPPHHDRQGARLRPALVRRPRPGEPASTCPSATSASCSSPRPPSPPAGASCSRRPALTIEDIKQVLLAGSFGSYLNAKSAIRIGLVPDVGPRRIIAAGNVAGEGAKMALLSVRDRAAALSLLEEVTYVELSDRSRLQRPLHRPAQPLTRRPVRRCSAGWLWQRAAYSRRCTTIARELGGEPGTRAGGW